MRPGDREHEGHEGRREQHGCDEPGLGAGADDAGEHIDVREADRISHAPPLHVPPAKPRERQHEEQQEQKWMPEAHAPPAQRRSSWTTARTPRTAAPPWIVTVLRPCRVCRSTWTAPASLRDGGCFV